MNDMPCKLCGNPTVEIFGIGNRLVLAIYNKFLLCR